MLKNKIKYILCTISIFCAMPASAQLELFGEAVQGAMLIGKTYPNAVVKFAGVSQVANQNGDFVIGLHSDEKKDVEIEIVHRGKSDIYAIDVKPRKYRKQHINGLKQKKVTPPKSFFDRIKRESGEIKKAREMKSKHTYFMKTWRHPTKGIITGVYGSRRILNGTPKFPHYGLDYATSKGTKIIAPQTGMVLLVQQNNFYSGKTIIIDHGMNINTAYLHLSKISVKVGQVVKKGDIIGLVGTTGRSTGAHLDWRLNWGKIRLDPALLDGIDLGISATGKKIH